MKKLKTTIRVTELQTVTKTIIAYYKNDTKLADDAFLAQAIESLEALLAQMTDSIHTTKIENNLAELDAARDKLLSNLGTALEGYSVLPLPELADNAQKVLNVFASYGKKIAAESFASESALLDGLLLDIQKEEIKACTKPLAGIDAIIEALQNTQNEFSRSYAEYTANCANKETSATELKRDILALLNASLLPYVNAMCLAQKAEFFNFARNVEAEIEKIESIAKARKTKAEKQEL